MRHSRLPALRHLFAPLLGVLLTACGVIVSPAFAPDAPAIDSPPGLENIQIAGVPPEAIPLFAENCSACHGPTGEGTSIAPPLNSEELRTRLDDEVIFGTIENGRPGTAMPVWGGRLTDDQIYALVALIRNWDQLSEAQLAEIETQAEDCGFGMGMHPGMGPMMGRGCGQGAHGPRWWPQRP